LSKEDELDSLLDNVEGNVTNEKGGKRTHVSAGLNPILMRLRLAALLIIGHKNYPDSLSRLTNLQASVFSVFDAIKAKTDKIMALPHEPRPRGISRYYAVRAKYGLPTKGSALSLQAPQEGQKTLLKSQEEAYIFYGLATFTQRFKAMSQSIMGDGRKEYLSGIEEKPVQLRYGNRDDLDIPKPSIYEAITGKPKRERDRGGDGQ